MYVRSSNNPRGGMRIPENYSGNAFSPISQYTEMPPPARQSLPRTPQRLSDISPDEIGQQTAALSEEHTINSTNETVEEKGNQPSGITGASIFSSLLPSAGTSSHFPFGHGLGSEELLIMAVMLLVLISGNEQGETDGELLMLLGLLLFAG